MFVFVQTWTLTVDEGQRIIITFPHFDIELNEEFCGGSACECDWLEIEGEKYCGELSTPWSIITNMNTVNIKFISDYSVPRTGFLAIWSATSEPPTTRTARFVSCGQHSAMDCSQCPYDGDTWIGEGWCHGDCHWRDEDQQCVISTTGDDLDIIYTTASTMTTTPTSSNRLESLRTSTTKPINIHNKDENSITTSKIDEENVIKSPNYPLPYPIYSHQV